MRILLLSTFLLSFTILFSQNLLEECGTVTSDLDYSMRLELRNGFQNKLSQQSSTSEPITFAVAHHIFLTNDGNPSSNEINSSNIPIIIRNLNDEFNPFNIAFETVCIDVHNSSRFNDIIIDPDDVSIYQTENAINIYYTTSGFCGTAVLPWSGLSFVSLDDQCAFTNTAVHELGHFLGLFHTHGKINSWCRTKELVNGSNCATEGDLICDTPADPNISGRVNNSCQYIGNDCLDANGDEYDPDVENFMSYTLKSCRTEFTPEQKSEMQFWANSQHLEDYILDKKWNFDIVGSNYFCANEKILLRPSKIKYPYRELVWTATPNVSLKLGSNAMEVSRTNGTYGDDSKAWVEASYISYCGERRTVRHDIWIEKPEVRLKSILGVCGNEVMVFEALPKGLSYQWFTTQDVDFRSSGNLAFVGGNGIAKGTTKHFNLTVGLFNSRFCPFSNSISASYHKPANCGGPCIPGVRDCPCPIYDPNCSILDGEVSVLEEEIWIHNTSNELIFHGANSALNNEIKELSNGLYIITTKEGSTVSKKKILVGDN